MDTVLPKALTQFAKSKFAHIFYDLTLEYSITPSITSSSNKTNTDKQPDRQTDIFFDVH